MNKMFFLIGNPRSGTTLLRLMLNNHPDITVPPECGFALWLYKKYKIVDFSDKKKIYDFLEDLKETKKFETWDINVLELEKYLIESKPKNYQEIVLSVYKYYAISSGKNSTVLGDKNNFYIEYMQEIKELFPQSKFIFLVRDGRDVACSYKVLANKSIDSLYAPKLSGEIEKIAEEWAYNNSLISREMNNNTLLVRYEDILNNPKSELEKMCDFLELEYSDDMLNYHINNLKEKQEPTEFLQWKEKTLEAPDKSNMGKYKKILSEQEISEFNNIAGDILKNFKYNI